MTLHRRLTTGDRLEVSVRGDHWQLLVADEGADGEWGEIWGPEAQRCRLDIWPGGLALGTLRMWGDFILSVELRSERPEPDERWAAKAHVVEAGIRLPTGGMSLYGPESTGDPDIVLKLSPADYSVLYLIHNYEAVSDEFAEEGPDRYELILWTGPVLARRLLASPEGW